MSFCVPLTTCIQYFIMIDWVVNHECETNKLANFRIYIIRIGFINLVDTKNVVLMKSRHNHKHNHFKFQLHKWFVNQFGFVLTALALRVLRYSNFPSFQYLTTLYVRAASKTRRRQSDTEAHTLHSIRFTSLAHVRTVLYPILFFI